MATKTTAAKAKAKSVKGSCHCGAVKITMTQAPEKLTACNCSLCRRYGVLWSYFTPESAKITGTTVAYKWKKKNGLEFHHCSTCGCITHWQGGDRFAVNARILDQKVIAKLTIHVLDGNSSWTIIDKFKKPQLFVSPSV